MMVYSLAVIFESIRWGTAMAARMEITATTIISSIRVNPVQGFSSEAALTWKNSSRSFLVFMSVDLNCDMGESFGQYTLGFDAEVMPLISSANIACGFHAGDPVVMQKTVQLAAEHGVGIGAHPAFPERPNNVILHHPL